MLNESKLKSKFTQWYYNKGYRYRYKLKLTKIEAKFMCPYWVLPLTKWLFSPSVYFMMWSQDYMKYIAVNYRESSDDVKKEV